MATIGVLAAHQKDHERPRERMKRSGGISLVNQGRAEWVIVKRVIRLLPDGVISASATIQHIPQRYDGPMPAAEVSGLRFDDPIKNPQFPRMRFLSRSERLEQFHL